MRSQIYVRARLYSPFRFPAFIERDTLANESLDWKNHRELRRNRQVMRRRVRPTFPMSVTRNNYVVSIDRMRMPFFRRKEFAFEVASWRWPTAA